MRAAGTRHRREAGDRPARCRAADALRLRRIVGRLGLSVAPPLLTVLWLLTGGASTAGAAASPATDQGGDGAIIGGVVVDDEGKPVVGVKAKLYTAAVAGPDRFLRPAFTAGDGRYVFGDLAADCYVIELEAPTGKMFASGSNVHRQSSCVDPGQTDSSVGAVVTAEIADRPFELTLVHVGDHHSHLLPEAMALSADGAMVDMEVGGFARVATKLAEVRAERAPERTIAIHSGGALGGTPFYSVFGGAADAAAMNAACFDLFAIGPEDLGVGDDELGTFLDFLADGKCRTEVIEFDSPPVVVTRNEEGPDGPIEHTVAIMVLPGEATTAAAIPRDDSWLSMIAGSAQNGIDRLVDRGIDNIVIISQIGLDADIALAARLSDVDVIIGSHALLGDFDDLGLRSEGPYPLRVVNRTGDEVCIGHAWHDALVVGELTMSFDDSGRIDGCRGTAHLLLGGETAVTPTEAVPGTSGGDGSSGGGSRQPVKPDRLTEETVAGYWLALATLTGEVVASATDDFCLTGVPGRTVGIICGPDVATDSTIRPSDVQRLVADGIRSSLAGTDIAIINSGAVSAGAPTGPITIEQIYRLLPYRYTLSSLRMSGSEVLATLEEAIDASLGPDGSIRSYPHAVGLRWSADFASPAGARVGDVMVREPGADHWRPLEPDATYVVATLSPLAAGGFGYRTMALVSDDGRSVATATDYALAFIDYLENELVGVVSPFRSDLMDQPVLPPPRR